MTDESQLSDLEHQELTALYQVTVQDLAQFKSQQWTLANYTILAFVAIVGVSKFPELHLGLYGSVLLCLVATAIFGMGVYILWQLKSSIDVRRKRLSRIRAKYSEVY